MKKLIRFILVLAMVLAAVSAFAANSSPTPIAFEMSWEHAVTSSVGLALIKPIPEKSKEAVNTLVKAGDLATNLYGNSIFIDEDANTIPSPFQDQRPQSKAIIPMVGIKIDKDKVEGKFVRISTPIPDEMHDVLSASGVKAVFTFVRTAEDGTQQYVSHVLDSFGFEQLTQAEQNELKCKNQIVYSFPVPVLEAGEDCPSFLSFVQV